MIQTDYCPDKFGTYLSHPESLGGGIDLSDASVREIILAYRAYRRTLERVRDMFVLLCNLGQRYSDIRRISPENFERNLFRIIQQKTGNKAVVDIDRYAIVPKLTYSLLKKYGYRNCQFTEPRISFPLSMTDRHRA